MQARLFEPRPQHELLKIELQRAVDRVVGSGSFILGEVVAAFEQACSQYLSTSHSMGVSNGSDALFLALEPLTIGPGDEVITTPFAFIATAEAIVRAGATPVFADIRPYDSCLCPKSAAQVNSLRSRAILWVHRYGSTGCNHEQVELRRKSARKATHA